VKFIGDRLLRKEDPRLVQGQGRYVGDITPPGMLQAAIVRSPHAHARILGIDTSRALEAPGVAGVVTFGDLGEAARPFAIVPPHAALRGKNFSMLAGDRARFVGEAVAVVLAESRYAAEDARALVDVSWEPRRARRACTTTSPTTSRAA
jgi:carbon-monoxide dehydrogenase large subunit